MVRPRGVTVRSMTAPSPDDIEAALRRISTMVRRTPVLEVDGAEVLGLDNNTDPDPGARCRISMKLEYLQQSGTFKGRGATNFMLANDIGPGGVTAASGGNHGAAVAWAARELGHRATIFVPEISSPAKVARLRGYGAEVRQIGSVYAESLEACELHQRETGATGVHAYEDPVVFAGAGTTGLEFERQAPDLDAVVVACGGGGLVGGMATWFGDRVEVVACETDGTAAYARAREAGRPVPVEISGVAADALGATTIGTLAFDALQRAGAVSAVVDDAAVVEARRFLWERFRIVVEPSAAVPVAALRAGAWRPTPGSHVGVVVCGANTVLDDLG